MAVCKFESHRSTGHKSEIGSIFRNPTRRLTVTAASKEYVVVTLDFALGESRKIANNDSPME